MPFTQPEPNVIDETLSADGQSAVIKWSGGVGSFFTQGNFGSGTAQLQYSVDGKSTWTNVPGSDVTHTAASIGGFQLGPCHLRVDLSGATSPSLNVRVNSAKGYSQ